ncbi:MAG: AAA family ATPase [Nitrospiraceae bacterium]|nr:MAG: AAA family ATPase [Nitrospiraceae bacterium]
MDFLGFFGLKEDPFKLTPDPAYFYPSSGHNEGLLMMDYSIDQKEGFILVIGDPGTGKTTLLKVFLEKWKDRAEIAIVLTPRLAPEEFLFSVAEDLAIDAGKGNKNEVIKALRDFMTRKSLEGRRVIIIVDEAQNLPEETLEELRLLSNLETDKDKLLQIILLGQPELEPKLTSEKLRQLNQRITTRVHLRHFSADETLDYINYRLIKAGKQGLQIHNKAGRLAHRLSKGVPRLINMLMSRSLMAAYLEESKVLLPGHIFHAVKSLNHSEMRLYPWYRIGPFSAGVAALLLLIIAAGGMLIHRNDPGTPADAIKAAGVDPVPKPAGPVAVPAKSAVLDHPTAGREIPSFKIVSVKVDVANIREKPALDSIRTGWSSKGVQMIVLQEYADGNNMRWYEVPFEGERRWISEEVVDVMDVAKAGGQ